MPLQYLIDTDWVISCLRYNLTLLTNNRRHFRRIAGLTITSA